MPGPAAANEPTASELFACCLLHAAAAGPDGRLLPTEGEISAMLARPPPRFPEALAFGRAFVEELKQRAPSPGLGAATKDFVGALVQTSEKWGGLLSAPFPGKQARRK